MSLENDFLVFAGASGANVLTQAAYAAASATATGYISGVASSAAVNKTLRQTSIMSAMIAQFIVDKAVQPVIDDGTIATIEANFEAAILAIADTVNIPMSQVTGLTAALEGYLPLHAMADTAAKLATARNIALTGAVTGAVNFDGSSNVSIATAFETIAANSLLANPGGSIASPVAVTLANGLQFSGTTLGLGSITTTGATVNGSASITGTLGVTGNTTVGSGTGQVSLSVNGGNSGSSNGSFVATRLNGVGCIAIGNISAIIGGTYNANPAIYYSGTLNFYSSASVATIDGSGNFNTSGTITGTTITGSALSSSGTVSATGSITSGNGAGNISITANGLNSGTNGGSFIISRLNGAACIAIGNRSALNGGAYDATPTLYYASGATLTFESAGTTAMTLDGSGNLNTIGTIQPGSDSRVKDGPVKIENALAFVENYLVGCTYRRRDQRGALQAGFIADRVQMGASHLVSESEQPVNGYDRFKTMDYNGAEAYLANAITELHALVQEQARELAILRTR